ncbi:MAG TPA: pirin family protein [Woeseiaceae bacterium]|nr:pirin family protein [Woeseiaceae bacterium]
MVHNSETGNSGNTGADNPVDAVLVPRTSDLGSGFIVQRALPHAKRRMVGPFVFFDQMGPTVLTSGNGLDVRPHPHIGLATVTYVFTGEILHRDSLGSVQPIRPGEVNWMTAGRGIVHSERTPPELRPVDAPLFGIQSWVALPRRHEETAPSFAHHAADGLPVIEGEGKRVTLIAGSLYGERAEVETFSEMFYADAMLDADATLEVPATHEERAVYIVEGTVQIAGERVESRRLVVLKPGSAVVMRSGAANARVMLLGGEAMDGPRHVWWNFVSSSRERIEQAKDDWRSGRFDLVPGETEFIPLPESTPPPVDYP